MKTLEVTATRGLNIRMYPVRSASVLVAMPFGMRVQQLLDAVWDNEWVRVRADFSDTYRVEGYASLRFLRAAGGSQRDISIGIPAPAAAQPVDDIVLRPLMSDSVPRRHVDELHATFRNRLETLLEKCKTRNLHFKVFEAFRTPSRQTFLYAKGRTSPGDEVTWVEAWGSHHNYGMASDIILDYPGIGGWETGKIDGVNYGNKWLAMRQIARECGLETLKNRKGADMDLPHVQLLGVPMGELRAGRFPGSGGGTWAKNLQRMVQVHPAGAPPLDGLDSLLSGRMTAGASLDEGGPPADFS